MTAGQEVYGRYQVSSRREGRLLCIVLLIPHWYSRSYVQERTIAEAKEMMKKGRREEQQDQSLSTDLPSDAHSVAQ